MYRFKSIKTLLKDNIQNLLKEAMQITIYQISVLLEIGTLKVHDILHDCLGVSRFSVRWVTRIGPEQELNRSDTCLLQELLAL